MNAFKSNIETVERSAEQVFEYLSEASNYEVLMPPNVRSFLTTEQGATLNIEGLGEVALAFTEKRSPEYIKLTPQNKVPFEFDLEWNISALEDNRCQIQAVIHAKLNFMMRMMAEKLLKNFLDVQVSKLKEVMNNA